MPGTADWPGGDRRVADRRADVGRPRAARASDQRTDRAGQQSGSGLGRAREIWRDRVGEPFPHVRQGLRGGLADQGGRISHPGASQPGRYPQGVAGHQDDPAFRDDPGRVARGDGQGRPRPSNRAKRQRRGAARGQRAARQLCLPARRRAQLHPQTDAERTQTLPRRRLGEARAGARRDDARASVDPRLDRREGNRQAKRACDGCGGLFEPVEARDDAAGRPDDHLSDHQGASARAQDSAVRGACGQRVQHLCDGRAAGRADLQPRARVDRRRAQPRQVERAVFRGGRVGRACVCRHARTA